MTLSEELQWRGLIKDKTFTDSTWLDTPKTFYLGSDCSSDSLTIGNLAIYMLARHLAEHGWKAVLLVGGATSLIGDPGGKDEERQLKDREEIAHNVAAIKTQVQRLFANNTFDLVDNYDWFKDIGYLEFLREVGKHYSMTELVQRDFIANRMGEGGSGISYAEFSYSLIQGYDYWWLFKNKGVQLQIGGSDQWGNMLSGAPLIRKKEGKEAHALSIPLVIDKATGKKFGKSEAGAIWLDEKRTPVFKFYQFWINVSDESVEEYLKIYTLLPKEELERLLIEHRQDPKQRAAQVRLAYEATALVHGEENAKKQKRIADAIRTQNPSGLSQSEFATIKEEMPFTNVKVVDISVMKVLTDTGLASSNTEARRLIEERAISINNVKTGKSNLDASDFVEGHAFLRKGKAIENTALIELG